MKKLPRTDPDESSKVRFSFDESPLPWVEYVLHLFLKPAARESISGDLLEEYRETILPEFGRSRARIWYLKQVLSLFWHLIQYSTIAVSNVRAGLALGILFSISIVLTNIILPLMEITLPDLAFANMTAWTAVFSMFGAAGFFAFRRTGTFKASLNAAAVIALASLTIAMLTFIVFDNLFLDLVSRQPGKIWLFHHSGFHSMRAYVNYAHVRALVLVLPVLTVAGSLAGALGAVIGKAGDLLR